MGQIMSFLNSMSIRMTRRKAPACIPFKLPAAPPHMHTDDEINTGSLLHVVFLAILNQRDSVYIGHLVRCVHKVRSPALGRA